MRHYHGTPMGGARVDVARFMQGRFALIPFPRKEDLPIVADICRGFVFDNGAFSIWKKGGTLDVNGYIEWCYEWHKHPGFEWALIPDVIDGTDEDNDALLHDWPKDISGVPVYHLHEDIKRLKRLATDWPVVALGSSGVWKRPGSIGWWQRIDAIMDAICDDLGRPKCKLHGLRMLDPKIFTHLPLSSADSTNVAQNKAVLSNWRGPYAPPTAWQRANVIADRIESHNSAAVYARPPQQEIWHKPAGSVI